MTTLLKASGSAEFLGLVPALAGFTPTRSIVLVPFRGSRAEGALRLDLPRDSVSDEDYADAAIDLIIRIDGADAVALVVYTDDEPTSTPDGLILPHLLLVDELIDCAVDEGIRIVDALCVTPAGWSSYLEDDPELTPLRPSDAAGLAPTGDQNAGVELPPADLAEKERVGRALIDVTALLDHDERGKLAGSENPQAIAAVTMLEDITAFFETLLDSPDVQPPFATAALLWCLHRPLLRDVALVQWATSHGCGVRTLRAQYAFAQDGADIPDDLGAVFLGHGPAPDGDRLRSALEVVKRAAASAPREYRTAPLTLAAWLSWALGRSTHADHYLRMAHEIDPRYGLAALLATMVGAGLLPEWAFRRGARTLD